MTLLLFLFTLVGVLCFAAALAGVAPRFNWLAAGLLFVSLVQLFQLGSKVF